MSNKVKWRDPLPEELNTPEFNKEITVLNRHTGKVMEEGCKHKNTTEKKTVYKVIGIEEIYISCNDCEKTLFAGWKPLEEKIE